MKHCLLLLTAMLLCGMTCPAQIGIDSLAARVTLFGTALPQEKLYLHIDNTCYFVGDTVWYKGYVTRTDRGRLTDLSRILYVELLTPDGYLVERQQLHMPDGTAHGVFVLTDSLYAGYYELRAYTRWMLNFGKHEHPHSPYTEDMFYDKRMARDFFRDYDKLYSRVFPVFNKPEEPGRYPKDMTLRPMRRYYKNRRGKPVADLKFYPEGGHLIAGVPNRVAFELNDGDGRHLEADIDILDKDGKPAARARTENRGRGTFTLTPTEGEGYKAVFRHGGQDYETELPKAEAQGYTLAVTQDDSLMRVAVRGRGDTEGRLGLQVLCAGVSRYFSQVFPADSGEAAVEIPLERLATGVNQITLFDAQGRIHADRLAFVNRHDHDGTGITAGGIKAQYAPFEPVELTLRLADPADSAACVSLAVRDHATDEPTYDNGTILTEMLLASELKGFVEDPGYYFEEDDDSTRRAHLDLLMMVQGWRRYDWRVMAGLDSAYFDFLPEKRQTLAGSVHRTYSLLEDTRHGDKIYIDAVGKEVELYTTAPQKAYNPKSRIWSLQDLYGPFIKQMKKEVNIAASFVKGTDVVEATQATGGGKFYMPTPEIKNGCILFLSASDTTRNEKFRERREKRGFMDEEAYPEYYVKLDPFFPVFPKPYGFYQDAAFEGRFAAEDKADSVSFTDRKLAAVTVRSRRGGLRWLDPDKPALVVDAYEAFNLAADYGLNGGMHDWRTFSRQVATALFGDMGMHRHYYLQERLDGILLDTRPQDKMDSVMGDVGDANQSPADFLLSDAAMEKYHRLRNLDKLYIYTDYVPREEGSWKYEGGNQPEVVIDYRLLPEGMTRATYRDRRYIMQGYAVCTDFYSPDYSRKPLPDTKDYRRTLLWMPRVKFDNRGEARIRLYNNAKPTVIAIEAEGITQKGKFIVWKNGTEEAANPQAK